MVKKLTKYEMLAYARTMLPMLIILLGVSALTRFVQFFESNTTAYGIVFWSSVVALVVSIIVCIVMTFFVAISRYYKNLFTLEGYLSFTLPVSPTQHIITKLFVAVIFTVISLVAAVLAGVIAMPGDVLAEVFKVISYLFKQLFSFGHDVHIAFYIVECIVAFFAVLCCEYLLFYACMTIGQLAKKNRVLLSFGVYFAYYFISQILGTVFLIVFSIYADSIITMIDKFSTNHPFAFIHIIICGIIVISLICSTIYFFVSHLIMRKKLNLE